MRSHITTVFLLGFIGCLAYAQEWKLQELKYHQEGLEVDLGVGLWAWPMPMDYDRDGDLDLVVACPDKPSNGVYFFEIEARSAASGFSQGHSSRRGIPQHAGELCGR